MSNENTRLRPGGLDDDEWRGSMAQAMMEAYKRLRQQRGLPMVPEGPQSKLLFLAIAQGLVEHLEDNQEAFDVTINVEDPT